MQNIICLMGPTAAGKTDVSLALADKLPIEIVSVDSAMVYQGMDIGTAKPSPIERQKVIHHLIDILDPAESYSAAKFSKDAFRAIEAIIAKDKIPLLVGGTMLYFKALQEGLSPLPTANSVVRKRLLDQALQVGWAAMHQRLQDIDPLSAQRINSNDAQRIQRALEVWELSHRPLSDFWQKEQKEVAPYRFINLALIPENRLLLHASIEYRFSNMIQRGLIDEVAQLVGRGDLHTHSPSMRCVGYRQVWAYLEGRYSYEEMIRQGVAATRQLAKKQLTWLRRWKEMTYFYCEDPKTPVAIENYLVSAVHC